MLPGGLEHLGALDNKKRVKIEIPETLTRDTSKKSNFFPPGRRSSEPANIDNYVKTYFINEVRGGLGLGILSFCGEENN